MLEAPESSIHKKDGIPGTDDDDKPFEEEADMA